MDMISCDNSLGRAVGEMAVPLLSLQTGLVPACRRMENSLLPGYIKTTRREVKDGMLMCPPPQGIVDNPRALTSCRHIPEWLNLALLSLVEEGHGCACVAYLARDFFF